MKTRLVAALACCPLALGGCASLLPVIGTHSAAAYLAAAADLAPLALAIAAIGAVGVTGVVTGPSAAPHAAGTFGAYLQDVESETHALVQKAMHDQREVVVVAGLQAQSSIARARLAYKGSLSLDARAVGDAQRRFQADIEAVIADLKAAADPGAKAAGDRAQAIADRLRAAGDVPQVSSYGPIFLFPSLPFQSVSVKGHFPSSYPGATVPHLSINGKTHKAFDFGNDSLAFSILTADLNAAEPHGIAWRSAEITIPWNKPAFEAFSSGAQEKFPLEIGVLPHSFGRATIDHTITSLRREEKVRRSEGFAIDANEGEPYADRCLALSAQELADGWRITSGSSAVALNERADALNKRADADQAGDGLDAAVQTEDDKSVCWRARTLHGAAGSAERGGKITWHISARLTREVSEARIASQSLDLNWGKKYVFDYAPGAWKLRYSKFGGGVVEVAGADLSNPLIKVNSDGRSVVISIYPH